jgi:hypothetical protein
MSRRKHIAIALTVAFLATVVGLSQTLIWKVFPTVHLVFWFPLVVITNAIHDESGTMVEVLLSLVQFPLLAICFIIGIRRWPVAAVASVIGCVYALMVLVAWIILTRHSAA